MWLTPTRPAGEENTAMNAREQHTARAAFSFADSDTSWPDATVTFPERVRSSRDRSY